MSQAVTRDLNIEAKRVHIANAKWWININTGEPLDRNVGELMMLVVSELAEALEGDRKNLQDDKLPHRKMFEVELADAVIRLLDIAGGFKLDLMPMKLMDPVSNIATNLLLIADVCYKAYRISLSYYVSMALQMIQDLAESQGCDLWGAYCEKMDYNAIREDHKIEARLKADGKKY